MIEISNNIFIGNDYDYYSLNNKDDWCVLHCCKTPFHQTFVGYSGNLSKDHPNYAYCIKGSEMALNIVDINMFDKRYLEFNKNMLSEAFKFLDTYKDQKKILIHCNQGESRGPSIGMLYIARNGFFDYDGFEDTYYQFLNIYPNYKPKDNIFFTVRSLWNYFV